MLFPLASTTEPTAEVIVAKALPEPEMPARSTLVMIGAPLLWSVPTVPVIMSTLEVCALPCPENATDPCSVRAALAVVVSDSGRCRCHEIDGRRQRRVLRWGR